MVLNKSLQTWLYDTQIAHRLAVKIEDDEFMNHDEHINIVTKSMDRNNYTKNKEKVNK